MKMENTADNSVTEGGDDDEFEFEILHDGYGQSQEEAEDQRDRSRVASRDSGIRYK
jgi:hypothetical protein